jgi:hypothetical protein
MRYYPFPRFHWEFTQREPNENDNPYFIIEHILACRVFHADIEEWHERYITRILSGLLNGDVEAELNVSSGRAGDYFKWVQDCRKSEMSGQAHADEDEGYILNRTSEDGVIEQLAKMYNKSPATIRETLYSHRKKDK